MCLSVLLIQTAKLRSGKSFPRICVVLKLQREDFLIVGCRNCLDFNTALFVVCSDLMSAELWMSFCTVSVVVHSSAITGP